MTGDSAERDPSLPGREHLELALSGAWRRVDLSVPRRVHVVGAGGTGMTPIATVLAAMGHTVSGSDRSESANLERLRAQGVRIMVGHAPANIDGAEVVVASSAVPVDNVELVEATERGVVRLWRAEALAAICATRRTLAVAGTKGKTTTSAMLAAILTEAGWDPSYIIGGDLHGMGHGARWRPDSEWLVVEADESDGTFLALRPHGVVVTNVLPDHVEFYGGLPQLEAAFAAFVAAATGPRVLSADDPGSDTLVEAASYDGAAPITFGRAPTASLRMSDVRSERRSVDFDVELGEATVPERPGVTEVHLSVPGEHNARNAAAALAMALAVRVPLDVALRALHGFHEVARRFEWRGERGGVTFVDDYAHLPSALEAVLATARQGRWGRVVAVFQPHRYSRTESLHATFADAFVDADVVVLTDVYPAGERPRPGVSGTMIADAVLRAHPDADVRYVPRRGELVGYLEALLEPGDLCLTLGAGDLHALATDLVGPQAPR